MMTHHTVGGIGLGSDTKEKIQMKWHFEFVGLVWRIYIWV
jgi:hypothetical protein